MTPEQSRMARAALKWSLTDLAQASGIGRATVARFELGEAVATDSLDKMAKALGDAGASFIDRAGRVGVTVPKAALLVSSAAILANRSFEELSASERKSYGEARQREATARAQAIVDNLNRNVMARSN